MLESDLINNVLCEIFVELYEAGLNTSRSGNISARDGNTMIVSPSGVAASDITPEKFAEVKIGNGEILYQLRKRFVKGKNIYTYIGDVLVSINPYSSLPSLYSRELKNMYDYNDTDRSFGRPAPHVWAIASETYKKIMHSIDSRKIRAPLPSCTKLAAAAE